MTKGVIGMPYTIAMNSEMSRRQFYSHAQVLLAEVERLRTAEGDAMTYKAGMENVAQQRDQVKAEVEALRKDSEAYRLLSFCHGQGTLELVQSHHELCAEIRRLKILSGEPVPPTPDEFVGPSPEGPTARIRRKICAMSKEGK
jgi:hypothetical protein